jgi:hypothetical protein
MAKLKHSQSRSDEHGNGRPGRLSDGTHVDGNSAKIFILIYLSKSKMTYHSVFVGQKLY